MIWTILDVIDADGTIVATYDLDESSVDGDHYLVRCALRDGYRSPYKFRFSVENRANDL